ncbi:MAG: NIL domain-containing protein [Planctomycetota bacterium]
MPDTSHKCRLVFGNGSGDQPCLWKMSRQFPGVQFDIRLDETMTRGVMIVNFSGDADDLEQAWQLLRDQGVDVQVLEKLAATNG